MGNPILKGFYEKTVHQKKILMNSMSNFNKIKSQNPNLSPLGFGERKKILV